MNRAALPAIFNPEDLNALEQALVLKDMFPGSTVEILTMGPGRAAEIIREGMYRGADGGVLLSDRKFAGSDTLATSYALSRAILNMKPDIIVAGGRPSTAIPHRSVRRWLKNWVGRKSPTPKRSWAPKATNWLSSAGWNTVSKP